MLGRGIFSKLATVFFLVGLLPVISISVLTYGLAKDRLASNVIQYWLVREARDLAERLDDRVRAMAKEVRDIPESPDLGQHLRTIGTADWPLHREPVVATLNFLVSVRTNIDLILILDPGLRVVVHNTVGRDRHALDKEGSDLRGLDLTAEVDPGAVKEGRAFARDFTLSPAIARAYGYPAYLTNDPNVPEADRARNPEARSLVFAAPIRRPGGAPDAAPAGWCYVVYNWRAVQSVLDTIGSRFQRESAKGRSYESGYAFLFGSDDDTIIGHKERKLYGVKLTDLGLESLHEAVARGEGQHAYVYPKDTPKIAGLARTRSKQDGGFGWTAGVGINDSEIFADVQFLRNIQVTIVMIVVGIIILCAAVFSRRLTEPITRLIEHTQRMAGGRLDERVEIRTNDEIAILADSFNRMVEELKTSQQKLIRAEKDAAWREMARQVAHEIKNPLTPIKLAAQQLERAHADRHPEFPAMLKDSVRSIIEQIESLRRIASNFSAYAAFPKRDLKQEPLNAMLEHSLDLYANSGASRIEIRRRLETPGDARVTVDKDEMQRVFLNLFNNAFEAMPDGGVLTVASSLCETGAGKTATIRVTDTGRGIPPEHRARLFEPYFSTRSGGTGLGLAICRKVLEEVGGSIRIESEEGRGTTVILTLPLV